MNMWKFQIYSFIGSLIWCLALAWVGEQLGMQWDANPALKDAFHGADLLIVALAVITIGWFVWNRTRARRKG